MKMQNFLFKGGIIVLLTILPLLSNAQSDSTKATFWKPIPRNYEVKQALEIESLFPMFFYGGWHVGEQR
jgi:hypothetical protein